MQTHRPMFSYRRRLIVVCTAFAAVAMYATSLTFAEIQWANDSYITVDLYSPPNGTYIPINHCRLISADAYDIDCYRARPDDSSDWSDWHIFYDDVRSGTSQYDYHMWWTTTLGTFMIPYGTTVVYFAPDATGSDEQVRDAQIVAHARDINIYPDDMGYNDARDGADAIHLNVWHVTLSYRQSGMKSENNDTANQSFYGDPFLGFNTFNNPAGCSGFFGNTEVKGALPGGPRPIYETWFDWHQSATGYAWHEEQGVSQRVYDWQVPPGNPNDDPFQWAYDGDTYHNGVDVDEVFLMDAPGFATGPNNNLGTDSPYFMTSRQLDITCSPYVTPHNSTIRVSDSTSYNVRFGMEMDVIGLNRYWKWDGFPHVP